MAAALGADMPHLEVPGSVQGSGFIRTCVVGRSTGKEASDRVQGSRFRVRVFQSPGSKKRVSGLGFRVTAHSRIKSVGQQSPEALPGHGRWILQARTLLMENGAWLKCSRPQTVSRVCEYPHVRVRKC